MFGDIPFESPKHKTTCQYPYLFPAVIKSESAFTTNITQEQLNLKQFKTPMYLNDCDTV